nr:hypothetical protein QKQZYOMX_QKQZYOMX_CDS_0010 [Microvirus sp.]
MERKWNTQFNGVCHCKQEHNCLVESEFYVPDERTSIQDFVETFMKTGQSPMEQNFRGICQCDDMPDVVDIYPSVTESFNVAGRYDEKSAEQGD